ncbi:uncharacterized protein FA14DRAFT_62138 [Meira miltonrushii]|uniref:protein-tyrosine-phosphatase n=1 Tax=Meira miltonrushii TaxID=1280837 RepID=A0A316V7F6_9BASI|nr:uncharacterized protein FA14DRAFT_62138 [Meira miltonrushii]PWN33430.1 hypothetical protein FA14DRAFT_62138 [Meira miltonrushii]
MESASGLQRPSIAANHSNGSIGSSTYSSEASQSISEASIQFSGPRFGEGTSNDYFASAAPQPSNPFEMSNPFEASSSSSLAPQPPKSEHPWSNFFGNSGPLTGAANPVQTPLHHPSDRGSKDLFGASSSNLVVPPTFKPMSRIQSGGSASSTRTASSSISAQDLARYEAIEVNALVDLLLDSAKNDGTHSPADGTLIIDIRPSTSYALARVKGSINVCAPSTLLKRAGVSVERIEQEMLTSEEDQAKFSGWRKGPRKSDAKDAVDSQVKDNNEISAIERIIVLDTDTRHVSEAGKPASGGGGPCLTGLLRKFDQAGFGGRLNWLVGGFNAFTMFVNSKAKNALVPNAAEQLLDRKKPAPSTPTKMSQNGSPTTPMAELNGGDSIRRASVPSFKSLGLNSGLQMPSTGPAPNYSRAHSLVQPKGLPMEAFSASSTAKGKFNHDQSMMQASEGASTLVQGNEEPSLSAANPFFDNVRQNKELQNGITERIPLDVPEISEADARRLPNFLNKLRKMDEKERADTLAQSFFEIEQSERDRLMATMQRHADESDCKGSLRNGAISPSAMNLTSDYSSVQSGYNSAKKDFPFSISAALERGSENRYNNIWTYEHSRVQCPQQGEYINGSFIEPAREFGCKRRYIATQAPLPSTFDTFWAVLWQQNVRTIIMATREFESGRVQSHNYWVPKVYGSLQLEVVEEVSLDKNGVIVKRHDDASEPGSSKDSEPNYFNLPSAQSENNEEIATIRRKILLKDQNGECREINHFQYIAWPDYSVPNDPDSLLVLMRMANTVQQEADIEAKGNQSQAVGPMVVHCSAGVGRTGTYILIDSVLDIIRRARWAAAGRKIADVWEPGWIDLDERGRESFKASSRFLFPTQDQDSSLKRKNLKRELSPSYMNLDSREARRSTSPMNDSGDPSSTSDHGPKSEDSGQSISGRDIDSPPPARRNRSEGSEGKMGAANIASVPFSKPALSPDQLQQPLPFQFTPTEGPPTPSTALGKLSLGSSSSSSTKSSAFRVRRSSKPSNLQSSSPKKNPFFGTPPPPLPPSESDKPVEEIWEDVMGNEGVELVRKVLDTIREQRMSMVQTSRQFVFAYKTIFEGVLQEMKREEAALERRLST